MSDFKKRLWAYGGIAGALALAGAAYWHAPPTDPDRDRRPVAGAVMPTDNGLGDCPAPPDETPPPAPVSPKALPPAELAAKLDALLEKSWAAAKVTPAPPASDAEFHRRLSLDVAGKIPAHDAARAYLDDPSPDKRAALVRRTLAHARFANHLAVTLRDLLMPNAATQPEKRRFAAPFEAWLRLQLVDNRPYDKIVTDLVAPAPEAASPGMALAPGPELFGLYHENQPEALAAGVVVRSMLGVQVGCAQCHNHFFADWKQDEFWGFAALFAVSANAAGKAEIAVPEKNRTVAARFLDGAELKLQSADTAGRRAALAKWLATDNKYLALAAANRVWHHFFGRGLVHPVDDMEPHNAPSHPEILDLLAEEFRRSGYDLKALAEALALTKAYALGNRGGPTGPSAAASFARMPVRHLGPEQLYDSLLRAAGQQAAADPERGMAELLGDGARTRFVRLFAEPGDRVVPRGGIVQALALLNGETLASATDPERGPLLKAALASPFLKTDAERLETLFLATLSRRPAPEEATALLAGLPANADAKARAAAFAGIHWALLNSAEFSLTP